MGPVHVTELQILERRDGTQVLQYRSGHYGAPLIDRNGADKPNWVGFNWADVPVVREGEACK